MTTAVSGARVASALLATVLSASAGSTVMNFLYPVEINARERDLVAAIACPMVGGRALSVRPYSYSKKGTVAVGADVMCMTEALVGGVPIRSVTACINHSGRWTCDSPVRYASYAAEGTDTFIAIASDSEVAVKMELLKYLLSRGRYMGYNLHDLVLGQVCRSHVGPTKEWIVDCGGASIHVARDCAGGECQFRTFGMAPVPIP
jgi:hypothetical protein